MSTIITTQFNNDDKTKIENYKLDNIDNDVDINNVKYQYLPAFMKFLTEDEILYCIKYYRYHDFEYKNMTDKYWGIHEKYLKRSGKLNEINLRENMSLYKILLKHFVNDPNIKYDNWIKLVKEELLIELSLRIQWEENRLLDSLKSYRNNNTYIKMNERLKWQQQYTIYEENNRIVWYKNQIQLIKKVEDIISNVSNSIKINYDEITIPLSNNEIYDKNKYDYLFNIPLKNIQIINGLYTVVDKGYIITTSKINTNHIYLSSEYNKNKIVSLFNFD